MRVLLADEEAAAPGVTSILTAASFTVDQTDTGREVLEMVRRYDYDLILLDPMLPDIEGYEVVRRLHVARIGTPVIMLSTFAPRRPRSRPSPSAPATSSPNRSITPSLSPECRQSSGAARL